MRESFEILGDIEGSEVIASGHGIRDLPQLQKQFGRGNWRKMKGFATVRLEDGTIAEAEIHWYEAHGIGKMDEDQALSRFMSNPSHFAVCVHNGEYAGTLELRKLYELLPDPSAEKRNYVRVIDESGEDYLYPASWFISVSVPESVEQLLHDLAVK